jgi:hypothetical protein
MAPVRSISLAMMRVEELAMAEDGSAHRRIQRIGDGSKDIFSVACLEEAGTVAR